MPTRYPIEALESAKYFIKQVPIDQVAESIIRRAMSKIWMAAPFTWTIGSNPSFNLQADVSEYDLTYPVDFGYAVKADMIVGQDLTQRELEVVSHLEQDEGFVGKPSKIYFTGPAGVQAQVRVSPKPVTLTGTPRVTSLYKRSSPVCTRDQIYNVAVPFPDDWFWVFEEAVLYEAYRYADDSRAGDIRVANNEVTFGGQIAAFQAGLAEMRLREPLVILTKQTVQKDPSK